MANLIFILEYERQQKSKQSKVHIKYLFYRRKEKYLSIFMHLELCLQVELKYLVFLEGNSLMMAYSQHLPEKCSKITAFQKQRQE